MLPRAEQRRSHRVRLDVPVDFTVGGGWRRLPGIGRDISLGGMFIEAAFPGAFGAPVLIGFRLPKHGALLFRGTVRWITVTGMGVQFGSLGARETHAITELERERGPSSDRPR